MQKPDSRRIALLVAANTALAPFAIDAYLPAIPALADAIEASVHRTELSISVFLLGFALGQLVFGPLSDRVGRRPVLFGGIGVFLFASLAITQVDSLGMLWTLRFVQALGGGASVVNSAAIVRDCFSGREAAKVLSTMVMIMLLAPLVAPALGSLLLYLADWWLIFVFLAVYAAFVLWLLRRYLPETHGRDPAAPDFRRVLSNYLAVLRHREAMGYICAVAMSFAGMFAFITGSPFLYMEYFGLSPAAYPFVFGANVVVMAGSNRLNIRLLRYRSPQRNLLLGLGVQLASGVLLAAVLALGLGSLYVVAPLMVIFVGMQGLISPNAMSSMLDHFPRMSATATALLGSVQFSCGALAGILVGVFEIHSAWPVVLTMLGAAVIGNLGVRVLSGAALRG
ncbi:MFS transporter, DHA1 family, bicyclomycin/chloramphenicol resistance protein [Modicisalibacter ilicicola DSM 19980]|uniref:Bcr/CflA family efflux transporter n=1 Tax=Modicisalibacter ilicicola DSM 19980 TaxID=1121942 RepID=A0A1M4YKI8_9GAMM|nr:Bcr/CflA family multidrug efflux MFS transporter [Halomonas ilicicola]SHF06250.1 MFS transporter, DHA1 family, bicyclomycin/chloramphenicol resistance protein [Halomonas ilicicola DSM 19980]